MTYENCETMVGMETPMDALDRTIVKLLQHDGRLSIPALAERAGTSRATAYARFDRLVDSGAIKGFRAVVDPEAMELGVAALLLVKGHQTEWDVLAETLRKTYGVEWVGMCAGRFDFAVLVRAKDLRELRDVVLDSLLRVPGVNNIETNVLLDEFGLA